MKISGAHLTLVEGAPGPGTDARTDDELALLARGGLTTAFDVLVRRYQTRVLRLAARHLGSAGSASDVAQNAFLAVYRALPRYQAREKFAAYLFRTVLNECRMVHRWHFLRSKLFASLTDALTTDASTAREPATLGRSAEELISCRESARDLARAIETLSAKLRDVVSLRYGAELGYEEIAATLNIPVGTAKRRLFDAIEKLRCQMRES